MTNQKPTKPDTYGGLVFCYGGVGSRNTPEYIQEIMRQLGELLAKQGFLLRSGGADGADRAFQLGAIKGKGKMEIYLPCNCWNGQLAQKSGPIFDATTFDNWQQAITIANVYHPAPYALKGSFALRLMARNSYQVLGPDLNSSSSFLICWTPNGSGSGGTGQAIRIAKDIGIPIYDLGNPQTLEKVLAFLASKRDWPLPPSLL